MRRREIAALSCLSVAVLVGGCAQAPSVSFSKDVKPILTTYCAECHTGNAEGVEASGFKVGSYEEVMAGTKFGPVVVPGDALSSSLYRLVAGKVDASIQMPHGKEALSESEIATIESWIEQGAKDN
jgi:hypothetical protein